MPLEFKHVASFSKSIISLLQVGSGVTRPKPPKTVLTRDEAPALTQPKNEFDYSGSHFPCFC